MFLLLLVLAKFSYIVNYENYSYYITRIQSWCKFSNSSFSIEPEFSSVAQAKIDRTSIFASPISPSQMQKPILKLSCPKSIFNTKNFHLSNTIYIVMSEEQVDLERDDMADFHHVRADAVLTFYK